MLVGDHLAERTVGRPLAGNRARPDQLELAVHPHRRGARTRRHPLVEGGNQGVVVERAVELELDLRLEPDDDRERRQGAWLNLVDRAVDVGPVEAPVEGDHLSVERVQGAEAEIAVLGELGEADVALVGAVEEGADRRGLKRTGWWSAWAWS
jgi:hypothetical protein